MSQYPTIRGEPAVTRAQATANAWLAELAASDKAPMRPVSSTPAPFTIKWLEPPVAPVEKATDFSTKQCLIGLGGCIGGIVALLALAGHPYQAGLIVGWCLGLAFLAPVLYFMCKCWRWVLRGALFLIACAWLGPVVALLGLLLLVVGGIAITLATRKV